MKWNYTATAHEFYDANINVSFLNCPERNFIQILITFLFNSQAMLKLPENQNRLKEMERKEWLAGKMS